MALDIEKWTISYTFYVNELVFNLQVHCIDEGSHAVASIPLGDMQMLCYAVEEIF